MSKNLTRKGLALVSGAALTLTSLVGIAAPANAVGGVTLAPTSGTGTSVFATDSMSLTANVAAIGGPATASLAFKINNPDQHQLLISTTGITGGTLVGYTSIGTEIAISTFSNGAVLVDFDDTDQDITSLVMHSFSGEGATQTVSVKLDDSAVTKFNDTTSGASGVAYGELPTDASISIQAWVEAEAVADYSTVDAAYASSAVDVTFVDPKNVSVISEVIRSKATGQTLVDSTLVTSVLRITTNVADLTANTYDNGGAAVQGVSLVTGNRVLLTGQSTAAENGVYVVTAAAGLAASDGADVAPVTNALIYISSGTSANTAVTLTGDFGTTALVATAASITATETTLNQALDRFVTANVKFSRADINLNQVDLTNWKYGMDSSEDADDLALTQIDLRAATENWGIALHNVEVLTPTGYTSTNRDAYGSILIRGAVTGNALASNKTYQAKFSHNTSGASVFQSTAVTTVSNGVASTAVKATSAVTSLTDATTGATPSLRAGTQAFTYKAQAVATNGTTSVATANVPMVAVVQAGTYFPTGESIAVTGSTKTITKASGAVIVAGLTDSKGQYSVTVTSTTAAAAQSYSVAFYIADGANDGTFVANEATITATYATAVPTTAAATPSIASSEAVAVTVSVKDQFGQAVSTSGTKALNVELKAPDKTNLELFEAVVGGDASFSFDNYLSTGGSDVLTVRVFTGSSTSPAYVSALDTILTMFAAVDVAGVNVTESITGVVVEYGDFITGKATTANPGPLDANKSTYTGTVVNDNGAGIAGAAVTIAAPGFQFKSGTSYTVDSVTVNTDAAGSFSVYYWTHVASATGVDVTATSGAKTATSVVKSAIPSALSTKNLAFSWNLPANLVMNTTYAVTAEVKDKWGNGAAGATVIFSGFGAATFNGAATATRTTDKNGEVTAYLRSLKDVDGPSAIGVDLSALVSGASFVSGEGLAAVYTDVTTTAWDESLWSSSVESEINFLKTAADAPASSQKVNAGSFKGYVAVYALGYEGLRLSAKVGKDWVIVPVIPAASNDLYRHVEFVGAGVDIAVRIYIDRVLVETINLVTK